MEKKERLILLSIIIILAICLAYSNYKRVIPETPINNFPIDTLANKQKLDSIEYNIIKKDSTIYNIKTEMNNEIKNSFILDDSSAIKLFYELCTSK